MDAGLLYPKPILATPHQRHINASTTRAICEAQPGKAWLGQPFSVIPIEVDRLIFFLPARNFQGYFKKKILT